jgi:hypothetical protein
MAIYWCLNKEAIQSISHPVSDVKWWLQWKFRFSGLRPRVVSNEVTDVSQNPATNIFISGHMFLQNDSNHLQDYKALEAWEPQSKPVMLSVACSFLMPGNFETIPCQGLPSPYWFSAHVKLVLLRCTVLITFVGDTLLLICESTEGSTNYDVKQSDRIVYDWNGNQ